MEFTTVAFLRSAWSSPGGRGDPKCVYVFVTFMDPRLCGRGLRRWGTELMALLRMNQLPEWKSKLLVQHSYGEAHDLAWPIRAQWLVRQDHVVSSQPIRIHSCIPGRRSSVSAGVAQQLLLNLRSAQPTQRKLEKAKKWAPEASPCLDLWVS